MSVPGDMAKWTFAAMEQWIRDTFAQKADVMSRKEYEDRHEQLQREADRRIDDLTAHHDKDLEEVRKELSVMRAWQANATGRAVGLGFVGAVLVAVVSAIITHLAGG